MCTDHSSSWPGWIQPTLLLCSLACCKVLTRGGGKEDVACTPLFLMWGTSSYFIPHPSHPSPLTSLTSHLSPSLLTSLLHPSPLSHPSSLTPYIPHPSHSLSLFFIPHIPHILHILHNPHPSLLTIQIILFKLIGLVFPTSDYQHSVVTPAMLFMGQLLLKVDWDGAVH